MSDSKHTYVYLGSGSYGASILKQLLASDAAQCLKVVTLPDAKVGRKQRLTPTAVKNIAEEHACEIVEVTSSEEIVSALEGIEPDFIVVCDFGLILKQSVIDLPRLEILNVHPSLLPKWRGASPIRAAIRAGDKLSGVSIMRVVKRLDAGPVYISQGFDISEMEYNAVFRRAAHIGSDLLLETFDLVASGVTPAEQEGDPEYCYKLLKSDGMLDFHEHSAEDVVNMLRSYLDWPTVYFEYEGVRFRVLEATTSPMALKPGEFLVADGLLHIGASSGSVSIVEFQPESKRAMKVSHFVRGKHDFFPRQ